MKNNNGKLSRVFHKAGLKLKVHSPEILVAAGIVSTVAGAVLACKATLKVNEVLDEAKTNIEAVHEATENGKTEAGIEYSEQDAKKDLTIVYTQTGIKLIKLYGPAILLGTLGIASIVKSTDILKKRNIALAAAYTAVDKGFKEYRGRVVERFGKEIDHELKHGIKAEVIEKRVVDENGNEKVETETVKVYDPNNYSPYSIVFDDGNTGWNPDPELTKAFLINQQNYANEILQNRGYLFLNEVYKMLGARQTKSGQVVGWYYDEKNPTGENFVDFGMFDIYNPKARDFVNGLEKVIILDFNVDGNIMDYVYEK